MSGKELDLERYREDGWDRLKNHILVPTEVKILFRVYAAGDIQLPVKTRTEYSL
jgi:hypothetical protein